MFPLYLYWNCGLYGKLNSGSVYWPSALGIRAAAAGACGCVTTPLARVCGDNAGILAPAIEDSVMIAPLVDMFIDITGLTSVSVINFLAVARTSSGFTISTRCVGFAPELR